MKSEIKDFLKATFAKFNINAKEHGIDLTDEIKLEAQVTSQDGTVLYTTASEFKVGVDVYIMDADGNPVPVTPGEYIFEDGTTILVGEDGLVSEMGMVTETEEEMSSDDWMKAISALTERIEAIESQNLELTKELAETKESKTSISTQLSKVQKAYNELKGTPATDSIRNKNATKQEFSKSEKQDKAFASMTLGERVRKNIENIK